MSKKILLGIHKEAYLRDLYSSVAQTQGYEILLPAVADSTESLIARLDEIPARVLMDINYGHPYSPHIEPILRTALAMTKRGYNLEKSLLGVSAGNGHLFGALKQDGINAVMKPDLKIEQLIQFLSD